MNENEDKVFSNTVINWLRAIQSRLLQNHYNVRGNSKIDLACLCWNILKSDEKY